MALVTTTISTRLQYVCKLSFCGYINVIMYDCAKQLPCGYIILYCYYMRFVSSFKQAVRIIIHDGNHHL